MRARRTQTTWLSVCLNGGSRGGGAVRERLPQSGVKSGCQARGPRLLCHYSRAARRRCHPDQPPPLPCPQRRTRAAVSDGARSEVLVPVALVLVGRVDLFVDLVRLEVREVEVALD